MHYTVPKAISKVLPEFLCHVVHKSEPVQIDVNKLKRLDLKEWFVLKLGITACYELGQISRVLIIVNDNSST